VTGLPAGWIASAVGAVVEPYVNVDPTLQPTEGFRYIDIGSIDNIRHCITTPKAFLGKDAPSRARRVVATNDVLFSTVRTYLKNVALVPPSLDRALTSTGITVLRACGAVDPRYLFEWVCSDAFVGSVSRSQDGTMYPAVSDSDVLKETILLPPLAEQRRIVAKIDALSSRSKRARAELDRITRVVKKCKQAILRAAFEGRLAGIGSAPVAHVRLGALVESGPQNGIYLPRSSYGAGVPILRIQNYDFEGAEDISLWQHVTMTEQQRDTYALRRGDLVINRVNSPSHLGKSLVVTEKMLGAVFESNMMRLALKSHCSPEFVSYYLNSDEGHQLLLVNAKWAVNQASINQGDVLRVPIPDFKFGDQVQTVRCLDDALTNLDRMVAEAQPAAALLDRLDQAVLAKAFRGELVPQDPNDEPASVFLERIRAGRAAEGKPATRRRRLTRMPR
jgi:type I restriction enzyme S subunit